MEIWMNFYFQDSASPIMEQMIFFHDFIMMIMIMIFTIISYIMLSLMMNKIITKNFYSSHFLELLWTFLPILMIFMIAIPSLLILYLMDENLKPIMSLKIMGHQWYWSYEYMNFNNLEINSYMINNNKIRLLETDNYIILPYNINIRLLTSSMDVIHSWTIPSFSIKLDAIPGHLNNINLMINRSGIFFGQCSEICGINHSFMPITIESINLNYFMKWINNSLDVWLK
uniref:Cytochrome c oxidase subunit 2 n=1 Tax=Eoxenos laboulbenei TaxID=232561 RepID=B7ZE79_9NEOP|nr:cytochrome oxidase subunit 2 [Eoxenos laboulbenei]